MIYFNGVALESVAPVMVEDIRIAPVQRTVTAADRPIMPGAQFVRVKDGGRSVVISFGIPTEDTDARQMALEAVARWAGYRQEGRLVLPHKEGRFLSCICTQMSEPSMRQWWESRLSVTFTTFDNPYFTSVSERAVACGTQLVTSGDAPPLMRITATLVNESNDLSFSDGTNTMSFAGVPAGELEIDLNRQTAAVDGASIMEHYVFGSDFIAPHAGAMLITGAGTVQWRERWIG